MATSKYAEAGVNIDTGMQIVKDIKKQVRETFSPAVLTDIGLFGGLFDINKANSPAHPVLVSSIDGVGTKLHIAAQLNKFYNAGRDIVAHCCNDIVVQGARPLFFMDYVASAKLGPDAIKEIITGIADECKNNGCALLGGETAEMPGTYVAGQYDLVGCIVGVVDREQIIDGKNISTGDVIIGLPSSGLHTNGYSLARKVLLDDARLDLNVIPEGCERTLGDILLESHRSYTPLLLDLLEKFKIKGLAHITGGGLIDNVPRILPENVDAKIDLAKIDIPPIYALIQKLGEIELEEMFRVFNMGIGMTIFANANDAEKIMEEISATGLKPEIIGEVVEGNKKVILK
ncbi:MAG: phosphoribosylformylglycinamidine cyclo-ligase [Chlamydiae bacterium]|nr:MAG: phosphoribosylformylglycinamidine cyclo-ligase [Chlamydiota bacterium]